jgi:hypothetical protein
MSNPLAIAAVTATLRHLLGTQAPLIDTELADLEVTTQPLDLARKGVTKAQLNVFLYQTMVNAAWRNHDLPGRVRPGETGAPPLALNLHYLITAYGRGDSDNDAASHRVLGAAMSVLHDHPLLGSAEIAAALADNDLANQVERVRITALPLGVEEMSKLWTIFQSQYRLSVAYEVAVVLIDSRRPVRAPLPVLKRGPEDRGVIAVAGLPPALDRIRLPRAQSAIRLGEDLTLVGENLSVEDSAVVFRSALLADDITLAPRAAAQAGELTVHIDDVADDPDAVSRWHPGFYLVTLTQNRADAPPISSNAQPFALAPRITVTPLADVAGDVALTVACEPRLRHGQRVLLIFADRQIQPTATDTPADAKLPTTLEFVVPDVASGGSYVVRLRVDGVDSIPAIYTGTPPIPSFDPQQTVVVS